MDWEDVSEKRAYAVLYPAEQIINWHSERVNGRDVLTLVVLKEQGNIQHRRPTDDFQFETVEQMRVLKLVPDATTNANGTQNWSYQVEVWQVQVDGQRKLLIADHTATPPGEGLKYYNEAGTQTGYDKAGRRPVISAITQAMLAKYGSLIKSKRGAVQLVCA